MKLSVTIVIIEIIILTAGQFAVAQNADICENVTGIPKIECEALVALYNGTNGNEWLNNRGWLTTDIPCSWEGVKCHNGHVAILKLPDNNLNGSLPPELENLAELKWLNLKHNRLRGNIPPELGNLAMLGWLDLSGNQLSGNILPELTKLTKLIYLNLARNQLSGSIPSELSTLTNLEYLNLSENQLCKPGDVAFQSWLENLAIVENAYELCPSNPSSPSRLLSLSSHDIYWLSVFTIILGGSLLIPGITMGVYTSLKQIYGVSYTYLFGYSRNNNKTIRITGIFNRMILMGGLFGIFAGMCCLVVVRYEKVDESFVFPGILLGAVVGVLYSWKEKIWKTSGGTGNLKKVLQGNVLDYTRRAWKTGRGTAIAGIFIGMTTGALTAGLFGELSGGAAGRIAGGITGIVVGGIAGFFGGLVSTMTGWFPGEIVGGIAGGIAGHAAYYRISRFPAFPLTRDSSLIEGFWIGIAGALSGIIIGYLVGILLSLIAGVLTKILMFIVQIMNTLVSFVMIPPLIVLRFTTIICNNCFRCTKPLKSRYEDGIRYCEHCNKSVEYTREPGKVRLAFGDFSKFQLRKMKAGGRRFLLVNPDFEQNNLRIDVSRVYIDTKTCTRRLFEGFLTYIINYPPKDGLQSVEIFHQGELEDLGDNLKNTLQNNFEYIKKVE